MTLAEESERPEHPWVQNPQNERRTRFAIPPLRCNATSNRTGKQCAHWATPGSTKCWTHSGAAPQVRRAAKARVTQATVAAAASRLPQLLDEPSRAPWAVMLAAGHTADSVARDLVEQVRAAGPSASAELVDRAVAAAKLAHQLSESSLRLGLVRLLVAQEDWTAAIVRATLLGVIDGLLSRLGASDEPALKLFCIRSAQAALSTPELSRPQDPEGSGHAGRAEAAKARLEPAAREAVRGVPWPQDVDLVVIDRAELDRLRATERPEQEGERDAKALVAAAPHPTSIPVMGRPGVPGGWRSVQDVPAPLLDLPDRGDPGDDDDHEVDDRGIDGHEEAAALVGRVVDVDAWYRSAALQALLGRRP